MPDTTALRRVALVIATWFGAGYFPVAPGTFGTIAGLPLAFFVARLSAERQLVVILMLTAVAIPAAALAGRALGVIDARQIVVDEVAGLLVTMLGVPFTPWTALAGFFWFRVFDVLKPWPASYFDRKVKNGAGVVLDDLMAGGYARLVMAGLAWMWPVTFGG